jgi:3-polyprenyl-4-hydroxybenzoate decarboxylase
MVFQDIREYITKLEDENELQRIEEFIRCKFN